MRHRWNSFVSIGSGETAKMSGGKQKKRWRGCVWCFFLGGSFVIRITLRLSVAVPLILSLRLFFLCFSECIASLNLHLSVCVYVYMCIYAYI